MTLNRFVLHTELSNFSNSRHGIKVNVVLKELGHEIQPN